MVSLGTATGAVGYYSLICGVGVASRAQVYTSEYLGEADE